MLQVIHKSCGGPAIELDPRHSPTYLKDQDDIWLTCFTCLDPIIDREDLLFTEEMGNFNQPM